MKAYIANRLLAFLSCVFLLLMASGFAGTAKGTEKPLQQNQTIVFTTVALQSMSAFSKLSAIYTEAFRRMGYGFKLIGQPPERAMVDTNEGIVDGEAARIMNIDKKKYPNLIKVPFSILTVIDVAYSTDHSIKIDGWESLADNPYRVGSLKGYKSVENYPLPIIFLTGNASVPISVRAMKGGAMDFLEKPFEDRTLLETID